MNRSIRPRLPLFIALFVVRLLALAFLPCAISSQAKAAPIRVALTVDDLPRHGSLPPGETRTGLTKRFLSVLKKQGIVEAYGFINAVKIQSEPNSLEVLQLWNEAGYPLGNHTYSHPDLSKVSAQQFISDLILNEPMLNKFPSPDGLKWFRYPFLREGETLQKRNQVRNALATRGYRIAQVTIDFEDWAWNDPYARCMRPASDSAQKERATAAVKWLEDTYLESAVKRLHQSEKLAQKLFGRPVRHVLLLHIGAFDSRMLDRLLSEYEKAGVEFIPLKEAEADLIYHEDPGVTFHNRGGTFLNQIARARKRKIATDADLPLGRLERICRS